MRRAISILVLVIVAGATAAPVGLAAGPTAPKLAAVTRVVGNRSGAMSVVLPRDVAVPANPFENDVVAYKGRGRLVGLVLVERAAKKPAQLISARWDFCGKPGCVPKEPQALTVVLNRPISDDEMQTLPAGSYDLYLIADRAPAEVSLELDELDGQARLVPRAAVDMLLGTPEPSIHESANHTVYTASHTFRSGTGIAWLGRRTAHSVGAGADGTCMYEGAPDGPGGEEFAFGPQCQAFADGWERRLHLSLGQEVSKAWALYSLEPGKHYGGFWHTFAGATSDLDSLSFWLDYRN
jgi:hypothetical protein